jgi:hypothetical protein
MTVATIDEPLGRWVALLGPSAQLAERIAGTEFVPKAMRGKPDVVLAAILYGDEIGVGPMQALAGIHVVEGRPAPSAELMRAMILRAGHTLDVHEMTGIVCRISGLRAGDPETARVRVEWSLDMARAAGLVSKDNWRKYPRAMLLARATSDLARLLFPDVVKGLGYVAEETATDLDSWAAPEIVDEAPKTPRKRVQRRSQPRSIAATTHPTPEPEAVRSAPTSSTPDPWEGEDATPEEPTPVSAPDEEPLPSEPPAPLTKVDQEDQPLPLPELEPEPAPLEPDVEELELPDEPETGAFQRPEEIAVRDDGIVAATIPRPGAGIVMIGPGMLRGLHATLGRILGKLDLDQTELRDLKLQLVGAIIGHPLDSTTLLTRREGMSATQYLMRIESGAASWRRTDEGAVEVYETREPPGGE